jgi:hypothetical protein
MTRMERFDVTSVKTSVSTSLLTHKDGEQEAQCDRDEQGAVGRRGGGGCPSWLCDFCYRRLPPVFPPAR